MCMDAKTLKSNASACIPVAQVHEKDGRWHHGGFRDHRAGEHRVLHAVVESGGFELLVNFGSIDTVSRAPRIAAPPETVRSRALCLACKPLCLCCDHLTCTCDRYLCFRRSAYAQRSFFACRQRCCSGARPAASSSGRRARSISMCLRLRHSRSCGGLRIFDCAAAAVDSFLCAQRQSSRAC